MIFAAIREGQYLPSSEQEGAGHDTEEDLRKAIR